MGVEGGESEFSPWALAPSNLLRGSESIRPKWARVKKSHTLPASRPYPRLRDKPMPLKAIILDLDGVITNTATAHAQSWKTMFDSYLSKRATQLNQPLIPFDIQTDYLAYVDGKPRTEGTRSFLASRKVTLPLGDPKDKPGTETICGLGNQKNILFQNILQKEGVEVYPSTLEWVEKAKANGLRIGLASSSKNTPMILAVTKLKHQFDAVFDGNDLDKMGLKGKPHPDLFLECAKRLGERPEDCAVVEDAISGVQAGRQGHFGLVLGLARRNSVPVLEKNGADIAVPDLADIPWSTLEQAYRDKERP